MLTVYHLTRWTCPQCGTFETGTVDRPDPAGRCPWCDGGLEVAAYCRGATSRPLPFTSDPRWETEWVGKSTDLINGHARDKRRKRNHGHGKSTGRRRGGDGRAVYRGPSDQSDQSEADRERYRKSKQAVPADVSDVFGA